MSLQDSIYGRLSQFKGDMSALSNAAGNEFGIKGDLMTRVGTIESNLNPNIKAKTSTATGLFQFTGGTWNEMVAKYGAEVGLPKGASRKDPVANAIMAAKYMSGNMESFKTKFGRDASDVEIYMGHFLGPSGRDGFIEALAKNPNAPANKFVGKKSVKSNSDVFFDKGRPRSLQEVFDMYSNKLGTADVAKTDVTSAAVDKTHAPDVPAYENAQAKVAKEALAGEAIMESIDSNQRLAGGYQPSSQGAPLGGNPDSPSAFAPMSATYEDPQGFQEERPWFDGAWDVTKAEARLGSFARWWNEGSEYSLPKRNIDSEAALFLSALGDGGELKAYLETDNGGYTAPEFNQEMYEKLKAAGVQDKWMDYLKVAPTTAALADRIKSALEMQKADEVRKAAPMSSQIVGGIGGALADPITYIGGFGGAVSKTLPRMFIAGTEAAVGNVISEFSLESETYGAIEGHYANAAIGGFLLGASLRGSIDLIGGASTRLKARQESFEAGADDITARPDVARADEVVDHPTEAGAVVLPDGSVLSAVNPLNPKLAKANEVPLVSDLLPLLSNKIWNAKSEATRGIGHSLVRAVGGLEGGGTGKAGMVAEDIVSMLEGRDFERVVRLDSSLRNAQDSGWHGFAGDREGTHRGIIEAIESGRMDGLNEGQLEAVKIIQENMGIKFDMATSPQQFGNVDAPAVFNSRWDADKYFPASYDTGKRAAAIDRFGGAEELQAEIKSNWREQWDNDIDGVRGRFKEQYSEEFAERLKAAQEAADKVNAKAAEMEAKYSGEVDSLRKRLETSKKNMETNLAKQRKARKPETRQRYADMAAKHRSFVAEYQGRIDDLEVKMKGKDVDQEAILDELVDEIIEAKSKGIARSDEFTYSSVLEDVRANESLVGIDNNNFTKERNPFSMSHKSVTKDGGDFALNDIRYMNIPDMVNMYNRRINGDIAIHGATGKTVKDLKDEIIAISDDDAGKEALGELVKVLTGKSRNRNPTGHMRMLGQAALDFGFFTKSGKFWLNQASEVSGIMGRRIGQAVRNGSSVYATLINPSTKWNDKSLARLRKDLFGLELNRVMQGSFQGYRDTLLRSGASTTSANITAGIRRGVQVAAQGRYNPLTRLFNGTTEALIGMSRSSVLTDIAEEALEGVSRFTPEYLHQASVTPAQFADILKMFKEHVKVENGKFTPNNEAIVKDPRALHLWRLADYAASDSITRVNKAGFAYKTEHNMLGQMALQFKSFLFKGIQGRTARLVSNMGNGRKLDTSFMAIMGYGTGTTAYAINAILNSAAMPEKDRESYLAKQFDPAMLAYQGLSRSPELGPTIGSVNMLGGAIAPLFGFEGDVFTAGRSTLNPETPRVKESLASGATGLQERKANYAKAASNVVPAFGALSALAGLPQEAYGKATAEYGFEQSNYNRSFYEHLRNVVPNDPITQMVIHELAMSEGYSQYQK